MRESPFCKLIEFKMPCVSQRRLLVLPLSDLYEEPSMKILCHGSDIMNNVTVQLPLKGTRLDLGQSYVGQVK